MTKNRRQINQQITKVFDELLNEYIHVDEDSLSHGDKELKHPVSHFESENEQALIKDFLISNCMCGKLCKESLSFDEIAKSRKEFSSLNWDEKNAFILSQLNMFMRHSDKSRSARQIKTRIRQKFDYHISIDRPVCQEVFLLR